MASSSLPTRLIIGVDGTWCTADGPHGKGFGNTSNVYRIYASIKEGLCHDPTTKRNIYQKKIYEQGLGSLEEKRSLPKLKAGIWGDGYQRIIQRVYEECSKLNDKDEVWLFGFSRGAYIVRAVAGLLNWVGALTSAGQPQFEREFGRALEVYSDQERRTNIGPGQIHSFLSLSTKVKPKIQFIGVFDTVKAVNDGRLHDISFNFSTQHMRHALALNEDREIMTPEYVFPDYTNVRVLPSDRTLVQAWFIGAHMDMGGATPKDGLALYPLQWMLHESRSKGLVLDFSVEFSERAPIDNPLRIVFPEHEGEGKGKDLWVCTTQNKIKIWMQDLQRVHELPKYKGRFALNLNASQSHLQSRKAREVFNRDRALRGYCSFAPQGTIIHPSVYQIYDEYLHISLNKKVRAYREDIDQWSVKMLGQTNGLLNQGFWIDRKRVEVDDPSSIRILVCGNTGVGKSTLINQVFGVDVTKSSDRDRGIHSVECEIRHPDRPDFTLHDSGGFEAGDVSQFRKVEDFVKDKSSQVQLKDRLHVIWFCLEMNSPRTKQTATEELFRAISKFATEIPIIVVATKRDQFFGSQFQEARNLYASMISNRANLMERCDEYAEEQVSKRINLIEREMEDVEEGRFDACVAVEKTDISTIEHLSRITMESFNHEKVRLMYIAAQTVSIEMKIEDAILKTIRIYRDVLGTAAGLGFIPTAPTTNRTASAIAICRAIIRSFGVPNVNYKTIYEIVRTTVWDDIGHNLSTMFAEGIAVVGLGATIFSAGIPFFLVSEAVNLPLVVPATTRLMLMLAADLILILARAFKRTAFNCIGQPLETDVQKSAIEYRRFAREVHKRVVELVPKRNLIKSFRHDQVRSGLEKIVNDFKDQVMHDHNETETSTISIRSRYQPTHAVDSKVYMELEEIESEIAPSYTEVVNLAESNGFEEAVKAQKRNFEVA